MTTDMTQLTGQYAAAWLPWIMIPLVFYILPFPIFALAFLWIEKENMQEESTALLIDTPMGSIPESMIQFNPQKPPKVQQPPTPSDTPEHTVEESENFDM
jgi:photosystem I subunit 8